MAARRRSLEERNLKTLRELAALPPNKQCFDCHQRGPTYVNITIGSFVCTSCSGILRGLTPPHRAKSITMATFTPEEIDFLKSRGNEYCKYVWLGTYDSRTSNIDSDLKDEHKKRELMSQKYEKKRWYVDPEIAVKKMQHDQQFQPKPITNNQFQSVSRPLGRVPEVQPLSQLLGKTPLSLIVENHQHTEKWPNPVSSASTVMTNKNTAQNPVAAPRPLDLLSEFASESFRTTSSQGSTANENFANFESAFVNSDKPVSGMPASVSLDAYPSFSKITKEGTNNVFSPPKQATSVTSKPFQNTSEDRYAALADLDIHFHQPVSVTSPTWSVETSTNVTSSTKLSGDMNTSSNPFISTSSSWGPASATSNMSSINPFQNDSPCLPFQQQQQSSHVNQPFVVPLPVVGNSPSEDIIRAQYGTSGNIAFGVNSGLPFQSFSSGNVSNPPNGYRDGSFFMQNGDFVTSPTGQRSNWGWPTTTSATPMSFTASQLVSAPLAVTGSASISAINSSTNEKCPNQFTQYSSDWMPNPANPFTVGSGTTGQPPKPSSTNPFL